MGPRIERAALLALRRGGAKDRSATITILLTGDAHIRKLNARFRQKDEATNVLSFPPAERVDSYLGDVALAYGMTAREAREAAKALSDHAVHLVVHGVLHLLGFDHEIAQEAGKMEAVEISVLAELGISDPYRVRAKRA